MEIISFNSVKKIDGKITFELILNSRVSGVVVNRILIFNLNMVPEYNYKIKRTVSDKFEFKNI